MPKPTILDLVSEAFKEATNELAHDVASGNRNFEPAAIRWLGFRFQYELASLAKKHGYKMTADD